MRALYYNGAAGLSWSEDPDPDLEVGTDALVRPIAVTVCDLDLAILSGRFPGFDGPFAIGHEGVGEVVEVGDEVTAARPGDIVSIPYHVSCGACDRCDSGLPLYCRITAGEAPAVFGVPLGRDYGGLFSELVRVPFADYSLVPVPPEVSPEQAVSVGDNLTDAWRAIVPHLRDRPGGDVLIMSTVSTGLFATEIALASGAGRVRYVDRDVRRLEIAERLGAETSTLDEFSPEEGEYAIVLNASDSRTALRHALLATEPGGQCESMAFHFRDVPLPLLSMHMKGVHFHSALANVRTHMPEVMEALASGLIDPGALSTAVHPIEMAPEVLPGDDLKPVFTRGRAAAPD